jgi:hypothetical protein
MSFNNWPARSLCDFLSSRQFTWSPGKHQLLMDHLSKVSWIASRLAAKAGLPRVGTLIGLAHEFGKYCIELKGC